MIPNKEIRWIFEEQVQGWFEAEMKKDMHMLEEFCKKEIGLIIELKYVENAAFDKYYHEVLQQINDRNYEEVLIDDSMTTIRKYGISCYKKRCRVVSEVSE